MKKELVKSWMSRDVITIEVNTKLSEAHQMMIDYRIRRLPVVDGDQLVGILTIGDVREAEPSEATSLSVWEVNYLLSELTVGKLMTPNPITISPYATIGEAAWMMLEYKISGLPVVNKQKKIMGVITESDSFRLVVQEWGQFENRNT